MTKRFFFLVFLFVLPLQCFAAAAWLQGASGTGGGPDVTTAAFGSNVGSSNFIAVVVASDSGGTGDITSVTDTAGNTYTLGLEFASLNNDITIWYAYNITGGSSFTVTGHGGGLGATVYTIVAQEFSGVMRLSNPKDKTKSAAGLSTAPNSGASAATTQANELVVGVGCHESTTAIWSVGAGYSNTTSKDVTSVSCAMESKVVSATGAQTASFTIFASRQWGCAAITFKDSSGDPVITTRPLLNMGVGP